MFDLFLYRQCLDQLGETRKSKPKLRFQTETNVKCPEIIKNEWKVRNKESNYKSIHKMMPYPGVSSSEPVHQKIQVRCLRPAVAQKSTF